MTDHRRGRALRYAALIATLTLTAAACGSDDDEGSSDTTAGTGAPAASEAPAATDAPADTAAAAATDAPAESDAPAATDAATGTDAGEPAGEPEKADIKLGIIPIADVAPVFIGIEQGFFEEEGLTVSTEFAQGGAASIPSVVSGDIDFAFGAYPSFFSAVQEGLPLLISTEANRAAPLFGGLYALPDSGIATPADLEGKTIAVNTLNNLVQLAVEAQLVDAGLTLDDVTLVEIPFPDMVAALERGDVDVIAVVEPFGTIAKNSLDAMLVTDMFAGRIEGFPVAGFYVTESFAGGQSEHGGGVQPSLGEVRRLRQQHRRCRSADPAHLHRDDDGRGGTRAELSVVRVRHRHRRDPDRARLHGRGRAARRPDRRHRTRRRADGRSTVTTMTAAVRSRHACPPSGCAARSASSCCSSCSRR